MDGARDKMGEVRTVKGLNWQEEIGMASEVVLHEETAPCVVFEDVPGTLPGSRVLVNFFGGDRQKMTLGFPSHLNKLELSEAFRLNYMADLKRVPPIYVNDGPIFENVMKGDEVDISVFPTPCGIRKTADATLARARSTSRAIRRRWINCGTYRVMIHDSKRVGFYISPGKHGRIMRDKYEKRGEPMPVAIVVGCDPMSFLMSSSEIPYGVCEYEVIGGLRGKPVELVKTPITGLPVPETPRSSSKVTCSPAMSRRRGRSANGSAITVRTCATSR